jgi:6-phosphogluconolactonase (cycloisomerase 2 family)
MKTRAISQMLQSFAGPMSATSAPKSQTKSQTRAVRLGKLFVACLCLVLFTGSLFALPPSATQLRYLYVTDPTGAAGQILGYSITPITGKLVALGCSPTLDPDYPVNAIVDKSGAYLYVANQFPTPEIATYSIDVASGCLTPYGVPQVLPAGSLPFAMGLTAHDGFLYVSDTFSDNVWELTNNPIGTLGVPAPTYVGPLQLEGLAVDQVGSYVFVANVDTALVGEIGEMPYSAGGTLGLLTDYTTTIPVSPNPFELAIDPIIGPQGQCLIATNNPGTNVTTYSVNASGGLVAVTSTNVAGTNPWGVTIDVEDQLAYVANNVSNTVSGYTIDPFSCKLGNVTGNPFTVGAGAASPEGLSVDPTGRFLYVADNNGYISEYTIDEKTGKLTAIAGSPLATPGAGTAPTAIAIQP